MGLKNWRVAWEWDWKAGEQSGNGTGKLASSLGMGLKSWRAAWEWDWKAGE